MIKDDSLKVNDFLTLTITSTAFNNGELIPERYTCDGENTLPPLNIEGIPEEAKSLALIIDDPDAPKKTWVHYVAWNIPLDYHIDGGDIIGVEGMNDFNQKAYGGPCPPSGTHRYFFKIYALNALLDIEDTSGKEDLEREMAQYIIAFGELMGKYKSKR
jgi:Raf kinase inhibitor-like YbhB/YbcL family protein